MSAYQLPADDLEYAVLTKLWEFDQASVRDVHDCLSKRTGHAYTTTAKVFDRLRGKGLIERQLVSKIFVYRSIIAQSEVEQARARHALGRLLGPRPHAAVAALVDAVDSVDPLLLDELERAVAAHRRSKSGT